MDTKVTDNDNTSEIAVDDRMDTKVTDNDNTSGQYCSRRQNGYESD